MSLIESLLIAVVANLFCINLAVAYIAGSVHARNKEGR